MSSRLAVRPRATFEAAPFVKPNPEEMIVYRRFSDPAEQRLANRWMATSVAVYGTLLLAILAFAHLTSRPVQDEVAQSPANAPTLARTVAR